MFALLKLKPDTCDVSTVVLVVLTFGFLVAFSNYTCCVSFEASNCGGPDGLGDLGAGKPEIVLLIPDDVAF